MRRAAAGPRRAQSADLALAVDAESDDFDEPEFEPESDDEEPESEDEPESDDDEEPEDSLEAPSLCSFISRERLRVP